MSSEIDGRLTDEQVQALAQLPPETIQRLGDVADKLDGRSRREILAMLGGAGVAAGGLAYGVGSATADPDGDPGVMGQQNDRLDAWVDQMDANVVDTGRASIGDVVGSAYLSSSATDQTIPSGSTTTVNISDAEEEDTEVVTVDTVNNGIDVDVDGLFYLSMSARFSSNTGWSTGDRVIPKITVNGSEVKSGIDAKAGTDFQTFGNYVVKRLSANDTVQMAVFHDSGGDRNIDGSQKSTRLEVARLG